MIFCHFSVLKGAINLNRLNLFSNTFASASVCLCVLFVSFYSLCYVLLVGQ
jgi:hypothetical protein